MDNVNTTSELFNEAEMENLTERIINNNTISNRKIDVLSSELNEISIEMERQISNNGLKYLPTWPAANLEFKDLMYSVPELKKGKKTLLRGIAGKFKSNELTAILGPSGSGKTTLLNVLAGFKCSDATGQITVNGRPRNMKVFRKMSRYIMQNEVLNPHLSVRESMMLSADLKLGNGLTKVQKNEIIDEILDILRLTKAENTRTVKLSGGEKKRLSIAMELVNNPPVIFLDEPTTGLDDISCTQCISLLRRIAHSGRTIVCSIHTPSAKIFEMFDHVYIVANGQCVYQGSGSNIVTYMQEVGLECPLTYNPADFIVEVASGEYGSEYLEKMVAAVDNGKIYRWNPQRALLSSGSTSENSREIGENNCVELFEEEIDAKSLMPRISFWQQFSVLYRRMLVQMWREAAYLKLKLYISILLGLLVGGLYQGIGNDASKALFNFGFAFTIIIAYMYKPMMPVLLQFPAEVRLLKREYFNQWYRLGPYFCALTFSKMPFHILLAIIYLTIIYLISNQPLELSRMAMLYSVTFLVALTSDSFGTLIASRLSVVNAMFVGPVLTVPLMLLSCYGIGFGKEIHIPAYIKFFMSLSYLRHGLEGLVAALYGGNRSDTECPNTEIFCMFRKSQFLLDLLGFANVDYTVSVCALFGYYLVFTLAAFYMIKRRLAFDAQNYAAVQYIGQLVKSHLSFASYN